MSEEISRRTFTTAGTTLGLLGAHRAADAADGDLRVGFASARITPEQPMWMQGYANPKRHRPSEGVLNDLYAKAMALEDAKGQRALLVAVDLCVFRRPLAKAVAERVAKATGLRRQDILLNLSHTHSGPLINPSDFQRFPLPESEPKRVEAYVNALVGKLARLATAALADLEPARVAWGAGRADFVTNRRQFTTDGTYRGMGPNPDGPADRVVPVLRVDRPDGTVRALVFGCACHNVACGINLKISSDYAGFAREAIERRHPGVHTLFMTGCGGDANPHPRVSGDWARRHGERLAAEVCRVAAGELRPVSGPLRTEFAWAELPLQPVPPRERLEQMAKGPAWESYNARLMLQALDRGEMLPTHCTASLAVWQFGNKLTLVAISGEVVSEYVPLVQKALGAERLWIAGYCNDVSGYLPTAKIVAEGGYEARGLLGPGIGWFTAKAQDVVVATVRELAGKAGRTLPR